MVLQDSSWHWRQVDVGGERQPRSEEAHVHDRRPQVAAMLRLRQLHWQTQNPGALWLSRPWRFCVSDLHQNRWPLLQKQKFSLPHWPRILQVCKSIFNINIMNLEYSVFQSTTRTAPPPTDDRSTPLFILWRVPHKPTSLWERNGEYDQNKDGRSWILFLTTIFIHITSWILLGQFRKSFQILL